MHSKPGELDCLPGDNGVLKDESSCSRNGFPNAVKEYLVKWKGLAHAHNSWVQEAELAKLSPKRLSVYKKKVESGTVSL